MGFEFPIRFVNEVAFFTTDKNSLTAPAPHLLDFFKMLQKDEWRLISGREDRAWQLEVTNLAQRAREITTKYLEKGSSPRLVSVADLFNNDSACLTALKIALGSFDLFVLGVADQKDSPQVRQLLRDAAPQTQHRKVLFLIPDSSEDAPRNMDFYDPFPGASEICRYPERWPGVLFWQPNGDFLFLPLALAMDQLPHMISVQPMIPLRVLRNDIPEIPRGNGVRLLHLSDLHCGQKATAKRELYLLSAISEAFEEKYDKIIISGDLFDSPWTWKWREYDNFRRMLRLLTKHEPLVIPGNHDERIKGNVLWRIGNMLRPAGQLEWKALEADEKLKCLFFSFNSAKGGNFARGEVKEDDLYDVAADFQTLLKERPEVRNWLRIAIVHHHPFKFDAEAEGWTAKMLEKLHIPEGSLVDMDESDRFVTWCLKRGIQLILFGHRHVQRNITLNKTIREFGTSNINEVLITAIGCGTSLGAEGRPLSFNIVTWNPDSQRWGAEFYLDESGSGFERVRATSLEIGALQHLPAAI